MDLIEQLSSAYRPEAGLSLERFPSDMEDIWHVSFRARSGGTSGVVEAYVHPDEIGRWGRQLTAFGTSLDDEAVLDLGGGEGYWPHTLIVRASIRDQRGHAVVEFVSDDISLTFGSATRLFIPCEVVSVNRLGRAVKSWVRGGDAPLVWVPSA